MENLNINSKITLKNGVLMSVIGLGLHKSKEGEETLNAVVQGFHNGYRLIDTAKRYENEKSVGDAIVSFGLLREEVFITTKLWNTDQGYENTLKAIDESLSKLGLSYVDLYLVHWPDRDANTGKSLVIKEETWRAMEEIYKSGKARAIGVSNYTIEDLEEMKNYSYIMPMVNQVEFHPFLYQKELLEYCKQNQIVLEAHTPLVRGEKFNHPIIVEIAKKYNKSSANILIRWGLQHGAVVIPGATNKEKIKENINVFDFKLSSQDMDILDGLNENLRIVYNSDNLNK